MRAAQFAEKLLRAVLGKQRAAAAIGDLVEIGCSKGIVWFWLSVFGCLIRALWRPVLGVIVVMYSINWTMNVLQMAAVGVNTKHLPNALWEPCVLAICWLGALMCGSSFYSAICYGLSDEFTWFAGLTFGLSAVVVYGWWLPGILPVTVVLFAAVLVFIAFRAERRWALITALTVSAISTLYFFALMLATLAYDGYWTYHGRTTGNEYREHPTLLLLVFAMVVGTAAITAATCSFMHNRGKRRFASAHSSEAIE